MTEKDLVNEAFNKINTTLTFYTSVISQIENIELRSALIQMRNQLETSKEDLCQIMKKLNYDIPSQPISQGETSKIKPEPTSYEKNNHHNRSYLNSDHKNNYISSQSNGILKHMDEQTKHALHASFRSKP